MWTFVWTFSYPCEWQVSYLTDARLVKILLWILPNGWIGNSSTQLRTSKAKTWFLWLILHWTSQPSGEHLAGVKVLLVWHILRWTSQTSAGPYREPLNQVKICQIMFICQSPCSRQEHLEMQQAVGDSCEIIYACQAWWCLCLCLSQNATDVIRVTLLEFR